MKPNELWENYARNGLTEIGKVDFLAALQEYGELVKAEAVKVCEKEANRLAEIGFHNKSYTSSMNAAAIKEMKLP